MDPVAELTTAVEDAAAELAENGRRALRLDRPRRADLGDYSTNAAMLLAPSLGEPPRAVAEKLGDRLGERLGETVDRVEVAGPGFVNLFMADAWYLETLATMLEAGDDYGAGSGGEYVNVEFVSANPTGPITIASARHAAYGDALARILERGGQRVEREYYVNDAGSQVRRFGESIKARARGEEPPEDGYRGDYVTELAERIEGAADADPDELARRGIELMLEGVRASLARFRVHMDEFFSERTLHEDGEVEAAIERLDGVYEHDGALWLRTTAHGDDKDRVLRRSNGEWTYFASDIAYHVHKIAREYDRAIDIWGADHHGHMTRVRIAWEALGGDPERLELLIMQLVTLSEGGDRVTMSKRAGAIVTLDDLLDDIGVDAARWFLASRSHDTTLEIDLELARSESQDNPVYYVQYAHARIASILRKAGEERVERALAADLRASAEQFHPSARALVKRLLELPGEIREAGERRGPHRIAVYATEAAQDFSAFYRDCRVVGAAEEGGDEDVRIAIAVMTMRVLAQALDLLGVEAPEQM
ncbi:MAG: arginyl-tRNA synthetase [Thermoleophilaceae bacterium]|jgi:arginyl-tRNA synthetase|nr:arginyl-tRNA synthetase [Thermoleophilaceae bacterium]